VTSAAQLCYSNGTKPRVERGNVIRAWHCPTSGVKHALVLSFLKHERRLNHAVQLLIHVTQTRLTTMGVPQPKIKCSWSSEKEISHIHTSVVSQQPSLQYGHNEELFDTTSRPQTVLIHFVVCILRQVHSLSQSEFSAECDLSLPNNNY